MIAIICMAVLRFLAIPKVQEMSRNDKKQGRYNHPGTVYR
jgi:hypothetical protein